MTDLIGVTVLGSTGSVGVSTLAVLDHHRDRFRVTALTANRNVDTLYQQCLAWCPRYAVMCDEDAAEQLRERLRDAPLEDPITVLGGVDGLLEVAAASTTDYVMAAIVGAAGLASTIAAARAGKRVLLANKEALVMAGAVLLDAARSGGAELLPIDSEHNALFQCLSASAQRECSRAHGLGKDDANSHDHAGLASYGITKLLLTASGGPFLDTPLAQFAAVTPAQALAHPNWSMGRKISVDSATMMNKGLEVIEACWLFGVDLTQIEVVIHPQSVIHSMVSYVDGSVLAQLGQPDMRTPIAHALAWPQRLDAGVGPLDPARLAGLSFAAPDEARFPCLRLAREAFQAGGASCAVLNAANEEAVAAFLDERLSFTGIAAVIEDCLGELASAGSTLPTLEAIYTADHEARALARICIERRSCSSSCSLNGRKPDAGPAHYTA